MTPSPKPYSYKVQARGTFLSFEWVSDIGVRFATQAEAEAYGPSVAARWPSVKETRVIKIDEAPTHSLDEKGQVRFLTPGPYADAETGGQQA